MARRFVFAMAVVLALLAPSVARAQSTSEIIFAELDGPRKREIAVQVIGE